MDVRQKKSFYSGYARMLLERDKQAPPPLAELPAAFYLRDSVSVAKELLGKYLRIDRPGYPHTLCRIVETEAYMGKIDRAAHASGGRRTARTEILYGPGGGIYIYLIYGMYACFNIVCNDREIPEAALIRAVEPVTGLDEMSRARFGLDAGELLEEKGPKGLFSLTSGPGKLCRALSLTPADSGTDLFQGFIRLYAGEESESPQIVETTRIGVDYAGEDALLPYRYYIEGNPFVSKT